MQLTELVNRSSPPSPWAEGDNIPWNEPGFSRRMLKEHLSQEHEAASRRFATIDKQVEWMHTSLLAKRPSKILDLGCGPGLYSERLARLGHSCHGIDYSPASIEYAITTAAREQLACSYDCRDLRQADFPGGNDLVMLIYGEFNIFRPAEAGLILDKAWQALETDGILLLEPHTYKMVQEMGEEPATWYSSTGGLFSDEAYLVLHENFWDADTHTYSKRYYVVDAPTGRVTLYAQSMQAYQDDEYRTLLARHGFGEIQLLPGLLGGEPTEGLMAIVAHKKWS